MSDGNASSINTSMRSSTDHAMRRSLGQQLKAAREELGFTMEAVAQATRIRVQLIRGLEADDLSVFSHPSYARYFSLDYAKFLGVPVEEIRESLPEPGLCSSEGYQYLNAIAEQASRGSEASRPGRNANLPLKQLAISIGKLFGLLFVIILLIYGYLFIHKLNRLPDHGHADSSTHTVRLMEFRVFPRPTILARKVPRFQFWNSTDPIVGDLVPRVPLRGQ